MIRSMISLLGSYVGSSIMTYMIYPVFCLLFLATIPSVVRNFFRR